MIYTVTLNPTLDITYFVDELSFGEPVNALNVRKTPGGKGINVSRAMASMEADTIALALLGGYTGDEVLDLLQQEGLILQIIRIEQETRTNIIVLNQKDNRELVVRSPGPTVSEAEGHLVGGFVFKAGHNPDVLVLSGSLPPGMPDDTYASLIAEGHTRNTRVVLDSTGESLRKGIEAGPYLIKPNRHELEELAGGPLADDGQVVAFSRELLKKGVTMVVVSFGGDGAVLVTGEGVWRGRVPRVSDDTVGAGDSMVAGLVMGIAQGRRPDQLFREGLACGVSAVMNEGPGLCEPKSFGEVFSRVSIEQVT